MTDGEEHTDVSEDQNVSATESKPDKDDLNKTVAKSEHTKDFESIRSIFSLGFRFSLQRSNSAILSYIPLCCITRYRVSCPDYGKLAFAVFFGFLLRLCVNSDICTLSVPSQRKAEKSKFRIEYTLIAQLLSIFTLSFNFFSRYAVLVPSNLSAARILFAKSNISSAYRITFTPLPSNSLSNLSR